MDTKRLFRVLSGARSDRRQAARLLRSRLPAGGIAIIALAVAFARGTISPQMTGVGLYVALVLVLKGALRGRMRDWDESCRLFPKPQSWPRARSQRLRLVAAAAFLVAVASARAQQTIFNVPTADVLDRGKFYLESDALWRPQEPNFALFTERGVYGFGSHIEAGFNFGGFVTPGRSTPTATAAIKWQPVKIGSFALTAGAHGLFFLRGSEDGDPAGHFYAHASYTFPTNTRITAGGWIATAGYAAPDFQKGALVGFEQKVQDHLNLIADWFSGKNGLGYFTPGVSSTWGGWTTYAGYSFKNGDSKSNAILLELGLTF
ncbi:MAG: hypothetical protein ACM3SU_06810 [Acidobacteriota bacterium]